MILGEKLRSSGLVETVGHHPSQIDHIQHDHEITQGRGQPARGEKLIDSPQKKRDDDDERFEQVEPVRTENHLKTERCQTDQEQWKR